MDHKSLAAAVAVATTDVVATMGVREVQDVTISLKNAGANALDALLITGRASQSLPFTTLLSVSGDYTTPKYPLQRATTDPTTLAAGASTVLFLKAAGLYEIQISASSAVGVTTLDIGAHGT